MPVLSKHLGSKMMPTLMKASCLSWWAKYVLTSAFSTSRRRLSRRCSCPHLKDVTVLMTMLTDNLMVILLIAGQRPNHLYPHFKLFRVALHVSGWRFQYRLQWESKSIKPTSGSQCKHCSRVPKKDTGM